MWNGRTIRLAASLSGAIAVTVALGVTPRAQGGLSITFGSFNNSPWPAGPDYSTDVLGDPWDFNGPQDLGDPMEIVGWTNFSVNGGVAGGTTTTVSGQNDTQLGMLYRGRYGIVNTGRTGRAFPIDPFKYQKLAFRMYDSKGLGDNPQVYWFHYPWSDPADPNSASFGAEYGVRLLPGTILGWQVYVVDLTQPQSAGNPWTGATGIVRGLRLDPNGQHSGQVVQYDWVRLTANDNAPGSAMQTISWSAGSGRIDVYDSAGTTLLLNLSTNASSPFKWNYGILPPGSYVLKVTAGTSSGTRAFTIKAPPIVQVTEPNETGGQDFATTVLGNAWDMDAAGDVQITGADGYTPVPADFTGGVMTATNTNNDPSVTLFNQNNNAIPIDTSKYRFLTFRMAIDGPMDLTNGSVARVFWGSQTFLNGTNATTTKDIVVWPGWNSYTIDLAALSTAPDGGLETSGAAEAWTSGAKRHLRLDPHEFWAPRTFHVDSVKLAAMAEATGGSFTIRWTSFNPDGGSPSVALYYDNDRDPSNGKTPIASGLSLSSGSFLWPTGGVTPGDYYIYAEASDGVQVRGYYSSGKVRVGSGTSTPNPGMSIDTPGPGSTVLPTFMVAGWAADFGASSGTGVDAVHVWAYPAAGGSPIFLGVANYFLQRNDVGSAYGSQFTNSGYSLITPALASGTYTISVSAHSTVSGTFNQSRNVTVTVASSQPFMSLDMPAATGSTIEPNFTVAGWAIDRAAPTGTGVDAVHVWAFPWTGSGLGSGIFLGTATLGLARPDIAAAFGSQFTNSGFSMTASGLAPGYYRVVVYAHSVVSNTFNNQRSSDVSVASNSQPSMSVDMPGPGATVSQPFTIEGWAIDAGAASGTGVDAVHVWAFPVGGGSPIFAGQATLGVSRPDIGSFFGAQFTNSGYTLRVTSLPKTTYDISVYAHSTVTGTFNQNRTVRITVK